MSELAEASSCFVLDIIRAAAVRPSEEDSKPTLLNDFNALKSLTRVDSMKWKTPVKK